jgi:hypothetical protein
MVTQCSHHDTAKSSSSRLGSNLKYAKLTEAIFRDHLPNTFGTAGLLHMTPQPFGHLRTHSGEALASSCFHSEHVEPWGLQYTKMIHNGSKWYIKYIEYNEWYIRFYYIIVMIQYSMIQYGQTEFEQISSPHLICKQRKIGKDRWGTVLKGGCGHAFAGLSSGRLDLFLQWALSILGAVDQLPMAVNQYLFPHFYGDEHPAILAIFGFTRVPGLWFEGLILWRRPSLPVASKACFFVDVKGLFETIWSGFLQTRGT